MSDGSSNSSLAEIVLQLIAGRTANEAGYIRLDCPFCVEEYGTPDTRRSFYFKVEDGTFKCFRCPVYGWTQQGEQEDDDLRRDRPKAQRKELQIPDGLFKLWTPDNLACEALEDARNFLIHKKSIPVELWEPNQICVKLDGPGGNVVFPRVIDGAWDGWMERSWIGKLIRYPSGMQRDKFYQDDRLWEATSRPLLVMEGPTDVLPYRDAVGCLGKPNDLLLLRLCESKRPVVFVLDGDAWGEAWNAAVKLTIMRRRVGNRAPVGWLHLPALTDPNDFAKVDNLVIPWAARLCLQNPDKLDYPLGPSLLSLSRDVVVAWSKRDVPLDPSPDRYIKPRGMTCSLDEDELPFF
jgi:hypothetical protein